MKCMKNDCSNAALKADVYCFLHAAESRTITGKHDKAIELLRDVPIYHHHRCDVYAVKCENEERWRHCTCGASKMAMKRTWFLDGNLDVCEGKKMKRIHQAVDMFAEAMKQKLDANDHKRGWDKMTSEEVMRCIINEVWELTDAENAEEVSKEAVDVANFCMFAWYMNRNGVKDGSETS